MKKIAKENKPWTEQIPEVVRYTGLRWEAGYQNTGKGVGPS